MYPLDQWLEENALTARDNMRMWLAIKYAAKSHPELAEVGAWSDLLAIGENVEL